MAIDRPTILQIIPRLDTGGAERTTIEIAGAIVRAGGRALVATEGGRMLDALRAAGGEHIPLAVGSKNPLTMHANIGRLMALVEERNVDILHARSRAPAWSALRAARRTGRAFVTTYHGAYAERSRLKALYNSVMARGDIVIANSTYTARLIAERYRTPLERVAVVPRGVDPAAFDPARIAPERIAALRAAWGIAADTPIVLHAARLTGWKGQSVLIAAAGIMKARDAIGPARFILAGDAQGRDAYRAALDKQIAGLGLHGIVRIVGHVDDVAAAYATAMVTIVPSTEPEAFGRAAIEAQAAGCPVIATSIGAPAETVRAAPAAGPREETGWLVPPAEPGPLADAMVTALTIGPLERRRIAANARANIAENYTLDAMRRDTLAVYDRLIGSTLAARFDLARA